MTDDDHAYYYRRAEEELEAAQRTDCTPAVRAHAELAERYLDLCFPEPATDNDDRPARENRAVFPFRR